MFILNKISLSIIALVIITHANFLSLPSFNFPLRRDNNSLEILIHHRFGRAIGDKASSSFFDGATVNLGINGKFLKYLKTDLDYIVKDNEINFGLGYNRDFIKSHLWLLGEIKLFSYEIIDDRATNLLYTISLSSQFANERFKPHISLCYNGYHQFFTCLAALSIETFSFMDIIGEIGFNKKDINISGKKQIPFLAGICFKTYGHNFNFFVSNSTESGAGRSFIQGLDKVYFGFEISRLFRIKK